MFKLTREVRFAFNHPTLRQADPQLLTGQSSNSYGGFPSLDGMGIFLTLQVTLAGEPDPLSQYVINIKTIDDAVRSLLPEADLLFRKGISPAGLLGFFQDRLQRNWGSALRKVSLALSPFQHYSILTGELPMIRLSQKFEFSASHRLHNPTLSEEENRACFGKCNNPHGHGHNYELEVTLRGTPDKNGLLVGVPAFEQLVKEHAIDLLDHKNLNAEVAAFQNLIPSVENIAKVIYGLLKLPLSSADSYLVSVTVWETPKTWCQYTEEPA